MKEIKFWADSEADTANFFNTLKAHGNEDDLRWTENGTIPKSHVGWFVDEIGMVTFAQDKKYFESHRNKEFFFPTPWAMFDEEGISVNQPVVSDGLSTSYYKLTITNKAGDKIDCEMGDVIRAVVGNDFDLGNVLKAARRMYEASQGRGKKDVTMHYDANKIAYFSKEFADWNEDTNENS